MPDEPDVTAESSTAQTPAPESSAGTQITEPEQTDAETGKKPSPEPFHTHPRFQQLIKENRSLKQQLETFSAKLAQLEQAKPTSEAAPSAEYVQAAEALLKVMEAHPTTKNLLQLSALAPDLARGYQGVTELRHAQQQALVQTAREQLQGLAKSAGLSEEPLFLRRLEDMVQGAIAEDEELVTRFRSGDRKVVEEIFNAIKTGMFDALEKKATASLMQTKGKVTALSPRPQGVPAGEKPPPKLEPGKEREYEESVHQRARRKVAELFGG